MRTAIVGAKVAAFCLLAGVSSAVESDRLGTTRSQGKSAPDAGIILAQNASDAATISNPNALEGDLVRAIRSTRFLFDAQGQPLLVVDWAVSATRPGLHVVGNTDIEIRSGNEPAQTIHFTGTASFSGVCAGGICSGCPIGLICSGTYCLCDTILHALSQPMNIEPGDRLTVRLVPARGGLTDYDASDNSVEITYDPKSTDAK
ncbi:hypothetical protein [Roseovarius sp. Pro17]|uniref:hypothetical protein n=1 Tax=Roseovarius sp. Pro17 TaxID=3108175 RepID=UPI002D79FB42|nr:hypothetical protein [Roseovarius sp. Pro17]